MILHAVDDSFANGQHSYFGDQMGSKYLRSSHAISSLVSNTSKNHIGIKQTICGCQNIPPI